MKSRFTFWTLRRAQYAAVSLIAVFTISACAPAATSAPVVPTDAPAQEAAPATSAPVDSIESTATEAASVQAVATSRGPNLEATDPSSVSLASGQLQLIEFFRFT